MGFWTDNVPLQLIKIDTQEKSDHRAHKYRYNFRELHRRRVLSNGGYSRGYEWFISVRHIQYIHWVSRHWRPYNNHTVAHVARVTQSIEHVCLGIWGSGLVSPTVLLHNPLFWTVHPTGLVHSITGISRLRYYTQMAMRPGNTLDHTAERSTKR